MKKFLILILILSFFLVGCGNNVDNTLQNTENNNYNSSRTISNTEFNSENNITQSVEPEINEETEISAFSTKIYTPDDSARQTNLSLTCSKLNGTIVKSRRNFFFL